jgi:ectoine hydroxylase-related dioxygenase (phytanoyl-CoA dioxygenase family)
VGEYPEYEGCSQLIAPAPGTRCNEERISQTWTHPSPFSDGFRRMIDNPLVNARLKWMIDPGFVMTTCYTIVSRDGAAGQNLHGGWFYGAGHNYHFQDGQPRTEQVNIGWLLQDVETATGDGGLMLIPGSHKARLPLPRPKQTSCDMPQVKHMQGAAGTVIMYTGSTTHGVRSWRNPNRERRFVNTKAGPNIRRPEREAARPSP